MNNITVASLVLERESHRVGKHDYNICLSASCDIVYYAPTGEQFAKGDLRERIAFKEAEGPQTVCYCHNLTENDIVATMQSHPELLDFLDVSRFLNMTECSCERHHPFGGNCACSPAVGKAVKRGFSDATVLRNAAARRALPVIAIYEKGGGCCGKTTGLQMVDDLRRRAAKTAEARCYDMSNFAEDIPATPELLSLMMEHGDDALPAIAINGRILWSGSLPSVDDVLTRLKHV